MAAPVPAVERAAKILDAMAEAPRRRFTAAELASAVGIHRATCFSIVSCLTDLGLLDRDPVRKTYRLGPGLVHLGTAAAEQYPAIGEARREMFRLADQLDVGGLICAPVGWEIVMIDHVASDQAAFEMPPILLTTTPLAPPIGAIFVAWQSADAIAGWLSRAPSTATGADMESFRRSVAVVRARGYSIGSETEVELQLEEILTRFGKSDGKERFAVALELADLVRTARAISQVGGSSDDHPIGHLIGPIFDEFGQVALTLTTFGRPGQIRASNMSEYADPLVAACARVTRVSGGLWPERAGGVSAAGLGSG